MPKHTYEEMDYEPMEMGSYEAVFTRYAEDEMEHGLSFYSVVVILSG